MHKGFFPWYFSYPAAVIVLACALVLNIWFSGHPVFMGFQLFFLFAAALWLLLGLPYAQSRYREQRTRSRMAFSRMQEEGLSGEERAGILRRKEETGGQKRTEDPAVSSPSFAVEDSGNQRIEKKEAAIDPGDWLKKMDSLDTVVPATGLTEKERPLGVADGFCADGAWQALGAVGEESSSFLCESREELSTGAVVPDLHDSSLLRIRELLEKEAPLSVDMAEVYCLQEGYGLSEALGEMNLVAEERGEGRIFQIRGEMVERL
ncbi:hypothetical protein OOT00_07660 [Desulfobotulus sp. H1]|uniref:Uncharacterized protein n=1 Tax=Desulfobotulus pelophilus TaxID=2823377 RepID=A0ABT3NA63_9BACT|nr:hypothetical protein [Desulfobotulus pelophilus]MCW7753857.1 hypothetical protein [Desulfobotulus pelophilus]